MIHYRTLFVTIAFVCVLPFSAHAAVGSATQADRIAELLRQIEILKTQLVSVDSDAPNISHTSSTRTKAVATYENLPKRSYVSLLWQDAYGFWVEVGQSKLPRKGGDGRVVVALTGVDSVLDARPTGSFKFRVRQLDDINWYLDSSTFIIGSRAPKPSCELEADNEYPGDAGTKVTLSWTSENADTATMRFVYDGSGKSTSKKNVNEEGSKVVRPNDSGMYIFTFFGEGGAVECKVHLSYKG